MKLILDFDDVLFNNTKQFKPRMFSLIENAGVPLGVPEKYYQEFKIKGFSLKNFLVALWGKYNIKKFDTQDVYEDIMRECPNFLDKKLLDVVKILKKRNCYLSSSGDKKFQHEKIKRSGVQDLFYGVYITSESKKDMVTSICTKNKNDTVVFVDDKAIFFDDLDTEHCKNLKTILYDEHGFQNLTNELEKQEKNYVNI